MSNPIKWLMSRKYRVLSSKFREKQVDIWMVQVGIDFLNFELGEIGLAVQRLRKDAEKLDAAPRPERRREDQQLGDRIKEKFREKEAIEKSLVGLTRQKIWHVKESMHMAIYLKAFSIFTGEIK